MRREYVENLRLNWKGWLDELARHSLPDVMPETWLSVAVTEGQIRLAGAAEILGGWPGLLPTMASHAVDTAVAGARELIDQLDSGELKRQWENWSLESDGSTDEKVMLGLRPAYKLDRLVACRAAVAAAVDSQKDLVRLDDAISALENKAKENIEFMRRVADGSWWCTRTAAGRQAQYTSECLTRRLMYEDAGRPVPWWWQLDRVYLAGRTQPLGCVDMGGCSPDDSGS